MSANTVQLYGQCPYTAITFKVIIRAHSLTWVAEFRAEPQNLPFSAEFWHCREILQKLRN